jgi:hypothetical protein
LINHQKQWREIVLDTQFPIQQPPDPEDNGGVAAATMALPLQVLYGRSTRIGTYWVNYLEKAYAKIYGSYAALQGGDIAEALSDLTGLPVVTLKVVEMHGWEGVLNYYQTGQLMACGYICDVDEENNHHHRQSHVRPNHAYSILDVKQLVVNSETMAVVRLRNPWGHLNDGSGSSSGATNSLSKLSKNIQTSLLQTLGALGEQMKGERKEDGTFWLPWSQFASSINNIYVCLNSNAMANSSAVPQRIESVGRWSTKTAGGCSTYPTFRRNPMYLLTVPGSANGMVTLTITQPDVRLRRRQERT